ncbi:hypothetical protein H0H92_003751 [Tricholoma furcatifolium]|nr:hypothetical protein H0H92_003751 [Tricholoma furcatifolium]
MLAGTKSPFFRARVCKALPRAHDASYLSAKHEQCLAGTRTKILRNLRSWAVDPLARTVYWLNGHAGSGKSTIAQSFCHQTSADGILGASFFCSRETEARSNLDMIIPTLCFQLASNFPQMRTLIIKILKSRPDIVKESLNNQLDILLIWPLEQTSLSTLIVIDALDECKDREPTSIILALLSNQIHRIPRIKWFITGRPEPSLRQGFRMPGLRPITEFFILHDVTTSEINHDIFLYLNTRLFKMYRDRSHPDLLRLWPPANEVQTLTDQRDGLFIFASTAVAYIGLPFYDPVERLSSLCCSKGSTVNQGRLGLDKLYTTVLEAGFVSADSSVLENVKTVIAAAILAIDPIPVCDLAVLLELRPDNIIALPLPPTDEFKSEEESMCIASLCKEFRPRPIMDPLVIGDIDIIELLQWVYDGRKLALEFREPVQVSASHLYHTALALAPEESLLRKLHIKALEFEVKILNGNIAQWPISDMTISDLHMDDGTPKNHAFSPNGKFFAVNTWEMVSVYDTSTGMHIYYITSNHL